LRFLESVVRVVAEKIEDGVLSILFSLRFLESVGLFESL